MVGPHPSREAILRCLYSDSIKIVQANEGTTVTSREFAHQGSEANASSLVALGLREQHRETDAMNAHQTLAVGTRAVQTIDRSHHFTNRRPRKIGRASCRESAEGPRGP